MSKFTLHMTETEMATKLAAVQWAAIVATNAETAVPLASWPLARGAEHGSVRLAFVKGKPGKVLRESLDLVLAWCES